MNSSYYIPKTPHIKSVVHSFWQLDRFTEFLNENIIPNGIVEVIFNLSDSPIPAQVNSKQHYLSRCFITGFNTAPIILELPKHQIFFGVRFQPLAVKKIFGAPAGEFADIPTDVLLLSSAFHPLWHEIAEQTTFENRVAVFCRAIEGKIRDWQPQENLINDFLCSVNHHDLSVTELAKSLYYSPRHLSRKIAEATGMNTEEILLYKKYLHAAHLIHHTNSSLTEIAYLSQFADQSHFIKSFKAFAKITPGEYKRRKSHLKGHIYENVR